MKTCVAECGSDIDDIVEIMGRYYNEKGYSLDVFDKKKNHIVLLTFLMNVVEEENKFNDKSSNFCASGYLKIPFTIHSLKEEKL